MDTNGSTNELSFSEKQKNLMKMLKSNQLRRINILYGSVRSGKTWISLIVFSAWVLIMPLDKTFLMCAKTLTSLKRNCLDLLQSIVGDDYFQYSLSTKTGILFGHKVYLEGANDIRSESKIRGMTLQGAYIDEITLVERDFFMMLLSRLSEPDAKLFGSTNPDSPNHWLKTDYIDRSDELDMFVEKFVIDDNTFLDPEYVKQIKSEYVGVFYDRFILGNFVLAEGIIYPMYQQAIADPPEGSYATDYRLSIDYGTMNAFAALLWEKHGSVWYATRGYYYSGRDKGATKTDNEYGEDLDNLVRDICEPWAELSKQTGMMRKLKTIIDPSAASFITLLRKKNWYTVIPADNDVIDGIRETATAMSMDLIKVSPSIKEWKEEMEGYVWDTTDGEDRPVKIADHFCDSTRYFVFTEKLVPKALRRK